MNLVSEGAEYNLPERRKPRSLTYEQARTTTHPRRCNVLWYRRGGALCCDLCDRQAFEAKQVYCESDDDPPLFRSREELP